MTNEGQYLEPVDESYATQELDSFEDQGLFRRHISTSSNDDVEPQILTIQADINVFAPNMTKNLHENNEIGEIQHDNDFTSHDLANNGKYFVCS